MPDQALSSPRAFAFGKLPTHGDFVARGLPTEERNVWDAWASTALETARAAYGEAFADLYDRAPPWRFHFGPGPFGPVWLAGALAPSMDAAGRRFIFVLGARAATGLDGSAETLAAAAEDQIYRTFEAGSKIDDAVSAAQEAFSAFRCGVQVGEHGRFWRDEPPCEITAPLPPEDLLVRALTL